MGPTPPRLRILSVGGNAVSAFLSWRLSATNACDVTLVWKTGFEAVAQYGITFKSDHKALGQERFKPRQVVRTPEEASQTSNAKFDYVILSVKSLPDVYELAHLIEAVVSPQHTCILVNTTNALGIESFLESRFPTNVVLSLVCGTTLTQVHASEFEHTGSTDFWVGAATRNPGIPDSIKMDMAEALAMTLNSGQVDCKVSSNILQQQYDHMIGTIAFHPASVLFETSDHSELIHKTGVRPLITGVIEELVKLAQAQGCSFPKTFCEDTISAMVAVRGTSQMYDDFTARRPLEIETTLGAPIRMAKDFGITVPRIETLYALLHNVNTANQKKPLTASPTSPVPTGMPPRGLASVPEGVNGHPGAYQQGPPAGRQSMRPSGRAASYNGPMPPRPRNNGPNGYPPRMQGPPSRGPNLNRRPSFEGNDLHEFSHVMLYNQMPEEGTRTPPYGGDIAMREREMALRQRELALREQEFHMRRGPPAPRRGPPGPVYDDDDDDDGEYYDGPMAPPSGPPIDPDNFDMMSVTSRRTRKAPSAQQLRQNPELGGPPGARGSRNPFRPKPQSRTSARLMADVPGLHESIMSNALIGYSSDRYATVDRANMHAESRTNSLTAERLSELQQNGPYSGPGPWPPSRRGSQSPGNTLTSRFGPGPGPTGPAPRRSPPGHYESGRPSPPGINAPMGRHPQSYGGMAPPPQRQEVQAGVSHLEPTGKLGPNERSLTGSASASAGSGESNHSARLESDPSAHSSQSSLGPRPPIGVR